MDEAAHKPERIEVKFTPAPHRGQGTWTMLLENDLELSGDLADRLLPGYAFEFISNLLQWVEHPVGIMLVISNVHALTADVPFADGAFLVRADFDDPVTFNLDLEAALDGAHYAGSLLP